MECQAHQGRARWYKLLSITLFIIHEQNKETYTFNQYLYVVFQTRVSIKDVLSKSKYKALRHAITIGN